VSNLRNIYPGEWTIFNINLARSGFWLLILKDTSALANAEASLSENQFDFSIQHIVFLVSHHNIISQIGLLKR